jgi:hypothetical protein
MVREFFCDMIIGTRKDVFLTSTGTESSMMLEGILVLGCLQSLEMGVLAKCQV